MKKEKSKHIAGKITALAAAVAMAAAFTFPIEVGNGIFKVFGNAIVASAETYTNKYDISAGSVTIDSAGTYRIYGSTTTNTVTVAKDVSANITLDNVNIDVSGTRNACAFKIEDDSTGNVTIDLVGENTLKSGIYCAGLQKNGSGESIGKLTIKSTSGTGKLTAAGGWGGAGIGGGQMGYGTDITISGGTVTANGGGSGAGIGGGQRGYGTDITISGGTVTASGGSYGAGIGGGYIGTGLNITISGGTVTANGGENGAGIGGGQNCDGSNITISGGTVTAAGGLCGAGIGGGQNGSGSDITISGGTVTATGGEDSAGIGGGDKGTGLNITISGGTVTANGGENGAGIGGGQMGYGTDITISGGTVTANGGKYGAGIGGGVGGSGSNITISGGAVTAAGGNFGAGIGGGNKGTGLNITISSGTVTATGGEEGAGIGGGIKGTGSDITISGGDVTATGGASGAGIGGGTGGTGEKITINGGTVTATGGYGGAGIGGGHIVYSISDSNLYGNASDITISGGDVTATGGSEGAGIGGGFYGSGSNITISGGTVTATGDDGGAGIGGGRVGTGSDIKISGGTVYAKGGDCVDEYNTIFYGADIGGGVTYDSSNYTYSDGVPATITNGTTQVYLREIENSTGAAITINGKTYPTNHNGEAKIYAYLPAKTKSDPNEVIVGNTITYCYYDTANSKWIDVNTVVTNTSFDVTASNVIVHYTTADGTELKSQTFTFNEVTEEMVDLMKSQDIKPVINFVNYSTDGSGNVILTDAQLKAIEYVLAHDLGAAA